MKKAIFLLLMVVLAVGLALAAEAAHPPGAFALGSALAGNSAQEDVVAPATVLAAQPFFGLAAGFSALPGTTDLAGQPQGAYRRHVFCLRL
jgi:hypothetical protein